MSILGRVLVGALAALVIGLGIGWLAWQFLKGGPAQ